MGSKKEKEKPECPYSSQVKLPFSNASMYWVTGRKTLQTYRLVIFLTKEVGTIVNNTFTLIFEVCFNHQTFFFLLTYFSSQKILFLN